MATSQTVSPPAISGLSSSSPVSASSRRTPSSMAAATTKLPSGGEATASALTGQPPSQQHSIRPVNTSHRRIPWTSHDDSSTT
ncbi:hypothetical protein ACEZCY_15430 [Streptacidiphilus sp. N1-12]|uniref:Uncharacterized protein n=2 Tax=Streptacidiphilus alkalitolerans TaxID=3342712 RepID=A0ABV6VB57_9ACTN